MKKIFLFAILLFVAVIISKAQTFQLKGLEIYNPVYSNPAFTSSDKLIQTDVIAYDIGYYNGYWVNAMSSLPNSKSSVGISIGGSKYFNSYGSFGGARSDENIHARGNSIGLSYTYTHSFTEQLKLNGGVNFTHSRADFSDSTITYLTRSTGFLNTGLKISYRKLYAGVSAGAGLYIHDKRLTETNDIDVTWGRFNTFSSSGVAGYSLGGRRRVNFDPIIGYRYVKDLGSNYSDFGFYAGGNITIVKTIGLGFTVGKMFSLSTSVSIFDRVNLMLGVFQFESNDLVSSFMDYGLGFDPLEFIAQLRIKL